MLTRGRGRRGRGRGSRQTNRLPIQSKHDLSVTLTPYIPPVDPPQRNLKQKIRRVIQEGIGLASGGGGKAVDVLPSTFFAAKFGLDGFTQFYLHRVSVWTSAEVTEAGASLMPSLQCIYYTPANVEVYPSFIDDAPAYNYRAKVGFHVPVHLSGPYLKSSTTRFLYLLNSNSAVSSCLVEIDATFC